MNQIIAISDALYQQLVKNAQQRGFDSIEQLIESLCSGSAMQEEKKADIVESLRIFRQSLQAKYGVTSDATQAIRQDRER